MNFFGITELQKAMEKDSDVSSHPISFPVERQSDIRRIFDPISYSKGASIIRMMKGFLGEEAFKKGVQTYLKKYKYSNAVQNDLWEIMTETGNEFGTLPNNMNIKDIMTTWTHQAGYPTIFVQRRNKDLIISQQRYILPATNKNDTTKWFIPISFSTQSEPKENEIPSHWMTDKDNEIVIKNAVKDGEWIDVNINRTGYYRVNYDMYYWGLFSKHYKTVPSLIKAKLIDDSLALARAELLTYDIPLTFLVKMSEEYSDILTWAAASKGLEYLNFMLTREAAYESFKAFMRFVVAPAYDHYGFSTKTGEDHVSVMHRARIVKLACYMGHDRCVNRAQLLFRDWIGSKTYSKLDPNFKDAIYATALREGGVQEWYFAYAQYKEATSASEKEILLNALGATKKPWLLSKYVTVFILFLFYFN